MNIGNILGALGGLGGGNSMMSPQGGSQGGGSSIFSQLFGGGGGYTSGDGLVNLPNLSPEDALEGLRSVLDFSHIYGPGTKVPNINFGGNIVSGRSGEYPNYLNVFGGG